MDTPQPNLPHKPRTVSILAPKEYITIQLLIIGFIFGGLGFFWLLHRIGLPITFQSVVTLAVILALIFQPVVIRLIKRILR
ncbi:MAG: hypothetical protein A2722_02190 [Candidatus Doudnabacteria bacterium RIFCSPHIGHO2_01_FULL_50_11]|uniref:Uncharacterized protein n=1 Tax=Candidatus Doudnabacteria bacterium RIFCSPHIGHO2_01_FULL_50_11 TaxID=1817828 RepID=A0A1F5PI73_9BACT|nr:MAG: hypothetical protein A2722_02190 [Candidatus Doudnabacteria bacterium RIFCSPHIGHO2_01_FULL_50_11]HLC45203.1 hypothetical protein [Patescibacteria group bacterium]